MVKGQSFPFELLHTLFVPFRVWFGFDLSQIDFEVVEISTESQSRPWNALENTGSPVSLFASLAEGLELEALD